MEKLNNIDPELWSQILDKFEQVKVSAEYQPETDVMKELEDVLGFSLTELDQEIKDSFSTQVIEIEKVHKDAVIPQYAYPSDSGFDLYSTQQIFIGAFGRAAVPTGLKVSFPENFELQIRPKSGLALKQGLTVLNTPGTVDAGYTGEIQVIVFNTNPYEFEIPVGMKIAQGVLCPVMAGKNVRIVEVDKIGAKDRGDNGFGSTGIQK